MIPLHASLAVEQLPPTDATLQARVRRLEADGARQSLTIVVLALLLIAHKFLEHTETGMRLMEWLSP